MPAPDTILKLVDQFQQHLSTYKSASYNETQVRREFIDPFFETLGWDMINRHGLSLAFQDVIHEDALKIAGKHSAPDYAFRIGGARKFFVEAKKPAINLKDEISPAYQLRRYAWSAKLPLSILTDFEEFSIYDCRIKPAQGDKPSTGRIKMLTFDQYPARWEEIESLFSHQAVCSGSFDQFAESGQGRHGTSEVDDAFLAEIERWRDLLARNIALRNPALSQQNLNYAVQMTIDRIIFLRICEDRGIEFYGQLQALLKGGEVYLRLCQLFQKADERYNSGLFHFHAEKGKAEPPDGLTPGLALDDKPLKDILANLYYPESPYEFSVLPADILGQVYEQFLGKVIRLTAGHQAKVEDKPEVKKAGGVFYTPTYIVEYIVKHTLGRLLEGKHPGDPGVGQGAPIRVLDMACGSGSFLIVAYQTLLDWYLSGYLQEGAEKWAKGRAPRLAQTGTGDWRLTTAERKRILLEHIYGVDIDPQAVEVSKLSLLLKVLEGESEETVGKQLSLFHERALPDLGQNIKCGNSLIGSDFYAGQQASFLDAEEQRRINAFDWEKEFAQVFASAGGFDVVVGNPPYIRMEAFKELKNYLKAQYKSHDERSDLYTYFIEEAHNLLNDNGRFGMIISNKFLRANYGRNLREFLYHNVFVERIVDFAGLPVFKGATVRTIILLTSKKQKDFQQLVYSPPLAIDKFLAIEGGSLSIDRAIQETTYGVSLASLHQGDWSFSRPGISELINRLKNESQPLKDYCEGRIYMGIKSGLTEAFVIDEQQRTQILRSNPKAIEIIKPFLNGRDIRRYLLEPKGHYIIYTYHGIKISEYSSIEQHLRPYKERLKGRATRQEWYELQQPQFAYIKYLENPKIVFPDIATTPRFVFDEQGFYGSNTMYFIPKRDNYLLGLLNSKLALFYFRLVCAGLEGKKETYLRFFGQYLEDFPVAIKPADSPDVLRLSSLVERMLSLQRELAAAQTPGEKTRLQRLVDATDGQIDALVYALYGLTEEEIRIVEGK